MSKSRIVNFYYSDGSLVHRLNNLLYNVEYIEIFQVNDWAQKKSDCFQALWYQYTGFICLEKRDIPKYQQEEANFSSDCSNDYLTA